MTIIREDGVNFLIAARKARPYGFSDRDVAVASLSRAFDELIREPLQVGVALRHPVAAAGTAARNEDVAGNQLCKKRCESSPD